MSHLITKNFNVFSAAQFKESLTEPANSIIYLFYGRHLAWPDDNNPPDTIDSAANTYYRVYDSMIGGKKVQNADVAHMVKRNDWTSGTVYDMYDDVSTNLYDKDFFVVVTSGTGYDVFKCLDNNYGTASTQAPAKIEVEANDEVYITTSDGYQWKYMYSITTANWDKFTTADYMPVFANTTVADSAVKGAINVIKVTDGGRNYASYANGYVREFGVAGNKKLISISSAEGTVLRLSGALANSFDKEEVTTSFLDAVIISNGGIGYTTSDTITVSGGSPTLAALVSISSVNSTGGITGLAITRRGKSYDSTPTLNITTSGGSGAVLTPRLGSAKAIIFERSTDDDPANTLFITIGNMKGVIDTNDEITGTISGTTANIASVTFEGENLSSNTDFYKGSSFYVDHGTGAGQIATIDEYIVTANQRRVLLASNLAVDLASDSHFQISPQVVITGDGEGAKARAVVNSLLNANVIANIEMISVGNNYTWADVVIRGNTGFVTNASTNSYLTSTASARAVISPPNGHGSDVLNELFANRIGISITLANTESGRLVANNDYRQIGLLKDPLFTNGSLTLTSSTTLFDPNERITGSTSNATAIVTAATSSEITIKDIRGFFTTGETVTGNAGGNAVINIVTQPTNVFRQTYKYTANLTYYGTAGTGLFEDELVEQAESLSNAYLLSVLTNSTPDGEIEVTDTRNVFLISDIIGGDKYITGAQSAATAKLTGVSYPQIKDGSGEILYLENLQPVVRDNNQSETFRLIIEF